VPYLFIQRFMRSISSASDESKEVAVHVATTAPPGSIEYRKARMAAYVRPFLGCRRLVVGRNRTQVPVSGHLPIPVITSMATTLLVGAFSFILAIYPRNNSLLTSAERLSMREVEQE
jgi:hypothetical protein